MMLSDEQILLKTAKLLENFDIFEQKTEKLLRELDETELEAIEDILNDLKGEDLAFDKLFDGKMRIVINFPTVDPTTELGKFAEFFEKQDYKVDWEKGMVYAERDIRNSGDLLDTLIGMTQGQSERKKTKKIQMKIGKFFGKLSQIVSKQAELFKIIKNKGEGKAWWNNASGPRGVTGATAEKTLSREQYESWERLHGQYSLYIQNPGYFPVKWDETVEWCEKMSKYWQTNAGYIKKNIGKLDDNKYSIILTRHPVDVIRMSDYNNITSCHSPPSRSGGSQEYYKCAVAEARGHGGIAYVVETEELLEMTESESIEAAEKEIQEGEIFSDDVRGSHIGLYHPTLELTPISRTRLRQVRYYDTLFPKRHDEGTQVAMPEKRVYGADIPGFIDRVVQWARENQEEVIKNMPKDETDDGIVDLDYFTIFGGSYEDTAKADGRRTLMTQLTGLDWADFHGEMKQDTDTEDSLDANAISGIVGRTRAEVEEIQTEWRQHYANLIVEADVEEDYDGGFYISVRATMVFKWSINDWRQLPNSHPTGMHAFSSITDIYGDIFDIENAYINKGANTVRVGCDVNLDHPDVGAEGGVAYDAHSFNEICSQLDVTIDDKRHAFEARLEEFFKMEGWMIGGEFIQLAQKIEDGEISSYEWDLETDGNYTESYECTATVGFEYDPEEWQMHPKVMLQLLNSREYGILLRQNILAAPKAEVGTDYNLDVGSSKAEVSGSEHVGYVVDYKLTFSVTADDPDDQVSLFLELIEGDMDDEDHLRVVFNKTLAQIKHDHGSGRWGDDVNERLVGTWKRFLRN